MLRGLVAGARPRVARLGVIVGPEMLEGALGANINGPSLIRVPDWVPEPLGRYYLYFAHHVGGHIRMAYADALEGPWTVHRPGVLSLADCPACRHHMASPDVHVDEGARLIVMYFHAPARAVRGQHTFSAVSEDGLAFAPDPTVLGPFYFRVWQYRGAWYALAKDLLLRSADPRAPFVAGRQLLGGTVRHTAVDLRGARLDVYFSRVGDAPEHILKAEIDLSGPWTAWEMRKARSLLRPETEWEGAALPVAASVAGLAKGELHELRDPCIFNEGGRKYLLYSVKGEAGIALAELS